jgi:hypothetical protein
MLLIQPTAKKRTLSLSLLLLIFTLKLHAQQPNGVKLLDSVKNYMETNYAGFPEKTGQMGLNKYKAYTLSCQRMAAAARNEAQQLYVIRHWLDVFEDHHIYTSDFSPKMKTPETHPIITTAQLKQLERCLPADIEGIYQHDTTYQVAIVKSTGNFRTYSGVVISSKNLNWKPGQIKFELISTGKNKYDVIFYNSLYDARYESIDDDRTLADFGWVKKNGVAAKPKSANAPFEEEKSHVVFFKQLNNNTGYLRIGSFDGAYAKEMDSLMTVNDQQMKSNTQLIIDIRNNGGGSDYLYSKIRPLIYTNPVMAIGTNFYATPDNTALMKQSINEIRGQLPDAYLDKFVNLLKKAEGKHQEFIDFGADGENTLPAVLPYPSRIAIIINRECASSAEQFLLEARQSKKVTMYGEHTMGCLDYSNLLEKKFHSPYFILGYPSTRSRRVDVGQGIDNKGIQPDVQIDLSKEGWFNDVLRKVDQ